ncbi:MAG: phosphoribosyltransferase [Chloroflexi bacterium]|nr:phosphoribosyltransferase [Chloroflexota bacterium]
MQHDTPASKLASALAGSRGWEWLPHHVTKDRHPSLTGIASAADRDATVDGKYLAAPIGGEPGLVIVVDDFCTRGATFTDIARAIRESNPGWEIQPVSLAKAERAAYWNGELTNAHIPDFLDAIWRGAPEAASPFY